MLPLDPEFAKSVDKMMRASLDDWGTLWFRVLVLSTAGVVIGILAEAPELWHGALAFVRHSKKWCANYWNANISKDDFLGWGKLCPELTKVSPSEARHAGPLVTFIGLVGWALVAAGVAGEGIAEYWVNDAETNVRAFDSVELADTQQSANSAAAASALAFAFSSKSERVSSGALSLANGARQEADSFETDIKSAKEQAADAESHLADALKQAVAATAELNRLKTPRTLVNPSALIASLQQFKGTEYGFAGVFQEAEAVDLLKQIDNVLTLAGWNRTKTPTPGGIVVNVAKDFQVPPTTMSGIAVEVESQEKLADLQALPAATLPTYMRAGMALKSALASNISPAQSDLAHPLGVNPGTSTAVVIAVGKKP